MPIQPDHAWYVESLWKACGKFQFLSNNCSAKNVYFSILLYRQYASNSLREVGILVKQLFGNKGVFFPTIVQALSRQFFKKLIAI
jgi:hypothetical protein